MSKSHKREILDCRYADKNCPGCGGSLRCVFTMYEHIECLQRRDKKKRQERKEKMK